MSDVDLVLIVALLLPLGVPAAATGLCIVLIYLMAD